MNWPEWIRGWLLAPARRRRQPFVTPDGLPRVGFDLPRPSAAMGMAVMQWHHWSEGGYKPRVFELTKRERLYGWQLDADGRYRGGVVDIPELRELTRTVAAQPWSGDIRDVAGVAASKGPIAEYPSLDDFATAECSELIQEVTDEKLMANWSHEGRFVREDEYLRFHQCAWDGRIFWINNGGSHHFAAARYLAWKLDRKLTVRGKLYQLELVAQPVGRLLSQFDILSLRDESYDKLLLPAFENAGVPHCWAKGPAPLSGTAVFLSRQDPCAQAAVEALIQAGVFDLGAQLQADLHRQHSRSVAKGPDPNGTG